MSGWTLALAICAVLCAVFSVGVFVGALGMSLSIIAGKVTPQPPQGRDR